MEKLEDWKKALDKLDVKSELSAEGLVLGNSCYGDELKGIAPASDRGCAILSTITGKPFNEVRRAIQYSSCI